MGIFRQSRQSREDVFASIATDALTKDRRKQIRDHYLGGNFNRIFPAGSGATPALLVGREQQLKQLSALVEEVIAPPTYRSIIGVVLHGPRGTGKTAMIAVLDQVAQQSDAFLTIRTNGNTGLTSADQFTSRISRYMAPYKEETTSEKTHVKGAAKALVVEGEAGVESQISSTQKTDRAQSVEAGLESVVLRQQKPLLLLVDEAHGADPSILGKMMNAVQLLAERHPIGFVLAGTPDTLDVLHHNDCKATWFRDRAQEERFAPLPNDLSVDACRHAITETLAAAGVTIKHHDDLEAMLPRCKGSPYFLQCLGKAALTEASAHQHVADFSVGGEIDTLFEKRIQDRYKEAWADLKGQNLASCARQLGCLWRRAERHGEQIDDIMVEHAIHSGLDHPLSPHKSIPSFEDTERHFKHLGLLWSISGHEDGPWSLGLPSFFDYAEAQFHASRHTQHADVLSHLESDMNDLFKRLGWDGHPQGG